MKQHKWHKEIKSWADGAEIESRFKENNGLWSDWGDNYEPNWIQFKDYEYRIKPQPKEPQYLYVHWFHDEFKILTYKRNDLPFEYLGKIKLETEE